MREQHYSRASVPSRTLVVGVGRTPGIFFSSSSSLLPARGLAPTQQQRAAAETPSHHRRPGLSLLRRRLAKHNNAQRARSQEIPRSARKHPPPISSCCPDHLSNCAARRFHFFSSSRPPPRAMCNDIAIGRGGLLVAAQQVCQRGEPLGCRPLQVHRDLRERPVRPARQQQRAVRRACARRRRRRCGKHRPGACSSFSSCCSCELQSTHRLPCTCCRSLIIRPGPHPWGLRVILTCSSAPAIPARRGGARASV